MLLTEDKLEKILTEDKIDCLLSNERDPNFVENFVQHCKNEHIYSIAAFVKFLMSSAYRRGFDDGVESEQPAEDCDSI